MPARLVRAGLDPDSSGCEQLRLMVVQIAGDACALRIDRAEHSQAKMAYQTAHAIGVGFEQPIRDQWTHQPHCRLDLSNGGRADRFARTERDRAACEGDADITGIAGEDSVFDVHRAFGRQHRAHNC
jgi:hypothetical protein